MSRHDPPESPSWPSLYNPGLEILNIQHNDPIQPGAHYLYRATDVFRFTLYWTLIFYLPLFVICGSYAFWNYAFPPAKRPSQSWFSASRGRGKAQRHATEYSLSDIASPVSPGLTPMLSATKLPKVNERRSRATFALIVLFTFLSLSLAGAVIGSAIVGFAAAGLYHVAKYNMSTWVPFLLSVLQVMIGLLNIWPAIIEII